MRSLNLILLTSILAGCTGGFQASKILSSNVNESAALLCTPSDQESCTVANGTGTAICDASGNNWGACTLSTCNTGFNLQTGVCVANACTPRAQQSCKALGNQSGLPGTQTCNSSGSDWGICKIPLLAHVFNSGSPTYASNGYAAYHTWNGGAGVGLQQTAYSSADFSLGVPFRGFQLLGDVNGDGVPDLVQVFVDDTNGNLTVYGWTGDAYGAFPSSPNIININIGGLISPQSVVNGGTFMLGDMDGDGLPDLLYVWNNGGSYNYYGFKNQGGTSGFVLAWQGSLGINSVVYGGATKFLLGDVDGDGKADLIEVFDYYSSTAGGTIGFIGWQGQSSGGFASSNTWANYNIGAYFDVTNSGTTFLLGDTDGDGKADLVQVYSDGLSQIGYNIWKSSGSSPPFNYVNPILNNVWPTYPGYQGTFFLMDIDGNGTMDLIQTYNTLANYSAGYGFEVEELNGGTNQYNAWVATPGTGNFSGSLTYGSTAPLDWINQLASNTNSFLGAGQTASSDLSNIVANPDFYAWNGTNWQTGAAYKNTVVSNANGGGFYQGSIPDGWYGGPSSGGAETFQRGILGFNDWLTIPGFPKYYGAFTWTTGPTGSDTWNYYLANPSTGHQAIRAPMIELMNATSFAGMAGHTFLYTVYLRVPVGPPITLVPGLWLSTGDVAWAPGTAVTAGQYVQFYPWLYQSNTTGKMGSMDPNLAAAYPPGGTSLPPSQLSDGVISYTLVGGVRGRDEEDYESGPSSTAGAYYVQAPNGVIHPGAGCTVGSSWTLCQKYIYVPQPGYTNTEDYAETVDPSRTMLPSQSSYSYGGVELDWVGTMPQKNQEIDIAHISVTLIN